MANWLLYHTEGCHLCEQARELTLPLLGRETLKLIDIMSDDKLIAKYQLSIPVLQNPWGKCLFWPFSQQQVIALINEK